jgi:hypothetical protein
LLAELDTRRESTFDPGAQDRRFEEIDREDRYSQPAFELLRQLTLAGSRKPSQDSTL